MGKWSKREKMSNWLNTWGFAFGFWAFIIAILIITAIDVFAVTSDSQILVMDIPLTHSGRNWRYKNSKVEIRGDYKDLYADDFVSSRSMSVGTNATTNAGDLDVLDDIYMGDIIYNRNDTDTRIDFGSNSIDFYLGNSLWLDLENTGNGEYAAFKPEVRFAQANAPGSVYKVQNDGDAYFKSMTAGAGLWSNVINPVNNPLYIFRNTSDTLSHVDFSWVLKDSAGNDELYASMDAKIIDATSTSEDGRLEFWTVQDGDLVIDMHLELGYVVPGTGIGIGDGATTPALEHSEFVYLDGQDQHVKTTSNVNFGSVTATNAVTGGSLVTGGNIGVSGDTDLMQLAANQLTVNGFLGVGVGTPLTTIHAVYDANTGDGITPRGIVSQSADATNHSAHITGRKSRGTYASPAALQVGDYIAGFTAEGYTGSAWVRAGHLAFTTTEVAAGAIETKSELVVHDSSGNQMKLHRAYGDTGQTAIGNSGSTSYTDSGKGIYSLLSVAGDIARDGVDNRAITLYAKGTYSGSAPPRVVRGYGQIPADNANNFATALYQSAFLEHLGSGDITDVTLYQGSFSLNNAASTVTSLHGLNIIEPTVTTGTITSQSGITINTTLNQATNNTYVLLGTHTIPAGNYAVYSASSYESYFAGDVTMASNTIIGDAAGDYAKFVGASSEGILQAHTSTLNLTYNAYKDSGGTWHSLDTSVYPALISLGGTSAASTINFLAGTKADPPVWTSKFVMQGLTGEFQVVAGFIDQDDDGSSTANTFATEIDCEGDGDFAGGVNIGSATGAVTGGFKTSGNCTFGAHQVYMANGTTYYLDSDGDVYAKNLLGNEYFYHRGDLDTYLRFQTNQVTLTSGNSIGIDITSGAVSIPNMKTGINQGAAGAAAGELWADSDDDYTVKLGQ